MGGENSAPRRKRQRRAISKVPYCRSLKGISSVQALPKEGLEISSTENNFTRVANRLRFAIRRLTVGIDQLGRNQLERFSWSGSSYIG